MRIVKNISIYQSKAIWSEKRLLPGHLWG